MFYFNFSVKG